MAEDTPIRDATPLALTVRLPEHVVHRGFAAERIALNRRWRSITGSSSWPVACSGFSSTPRPLREAAQQLALDYEQAIQMIEEDLCSRCPDLAERGLIDTNARLV
ncbi:MAG: hypothetical protein M3350_05640 [Actinomycetota bacterium]|nr:hypothetical protein [Actinomycetota bacterium]